MLSSVNSSGTALQTKERLWFVKVSLDEYLKNGRVVFQGHCRINVTVNCISDPFM